jgi:hypothetical protein
MAAAAMRFASMMAELDDDDDVQPKAAEPAASDSTPAATSKAPEAIPEIGSKAESAADMIQRHQVELAAVEEQCRVKISENKKKSKIFRDAAHEECANIKRECLERHDKELSKLPATELALARKLANTSLSEEPADDKPGFAYANSDGKKKGKQQKKKEAKAQEEEKRYQEAKAAMKDWIDPKEVEEKQLQVTYVLQHDHAMCMFDFQRSIDGTRDPPQAKLDMIGMRVHAVEADGHCM